MKWNLWLSDEYKIAAMSLFSNTIKIMKYNQILLPLAGTLLVGISPLVRADDDSWSEKNRVQIGYRMGFNMSLNLRNIAPQSVNAASITGRSYQDGFVGTDDTGNIAGLTTYWGYQNASQVTSGDGAVLMHYSGSGTLASDVNNGDLQHGAELTYDRELLRFKHVRLGAEFAFNWTEFSANKGLTASTGIMGVDAFSLGYTPPGAPYSGPQHAGPYIPLLGTSASTSPVMVSSDFDAKLYGFRLGPYVDAPLGKRILLTASAGLAVTLVDSQFSYQQHDAVSGDPAVSSGSASDFSAVVGGYVGIQATVRIVKHVDLFTGFQYQASDSYQLRAGDKQAELDFGNSFYWTIGVSYCF